MVDDPELTWVILTVGGRGAATRVAIDSVSPNVLVVLNGVDGQHLGECSIATVATAENVGIPAGRDRGVRSTSSALVGFLDDDAIAPAGAGGAIAAAFAGDPRLGAVALRLVDEHGQTARRHVPRLGGRGPTLGGEVALFLGGACAIRRTAYDEVGGYWGELFYGHEELELAWRLADHGWRIRYVPEVEVFHPRTEIGRHSEGWRMTGRNRVMIARRTLPWPVAITHVLTWLVLGLLRAPGRSSRSAYLRGWMAGWRVPVDRDAIRWRTVLRLTRLGRPPIV